ncbi:MAG: efflux RND transporter periplasmic adaptor subunit [Candidatus Lindowbacteria bacterium]|nr:efflux RND transporter periplasmic adaptor subunit [Candidatus Lindowbacteria bacterium]
MKQWYKLATAIAGSVALLVLMLLWLMGSLSPGGKIHPGKSEVKETPSAGLKTIKVTAITILVEAEVVGTVRARETAEITSKIVATVTSVDADAGNNVRKGQTLFVLDSRDAQARVNQAREAVASAEAALEQATLDAGRIERLYQKQAATKQEFDRSQAGLKIARASADSARAMLREAEVNLSYTKITSPISGKVTDRFANPGDMAMPGKPLMTVYDPSTLRLEVSVAEHLRPRVSIGQQVRASIDHAGAVFDTKIVEMVPASDSSSRSFIVRASIPSAQTAYPGMYARIWLQVGESEVVLIPPDALEHVGQLEMVTVVENEIARKRSVKTGNTHREGIEILSGLTAGEVIAVP